MTSLRSRLRSAEDDFLAALLSGEDAVTRFNTQWDALVEDLNAASDAGSLDDDISSLAYATAIRVATLADTSIEVLGSCDTISSQLMHQLNDLMSELDINDFHCSTDFGLSHCTPLSNPLSPISCAERSSKKRRRSISPEGRGISGRKRHSPNFFPTTPTHLFPTCSKVHETSTPSLPQQATPGLPLAQPRSSRKRRLSDAESSSPLTAKRLHVGPRLHAVSDSFVELHKSRLVTSNTTSPRPLTACERAIPSPPAPACLDVGTSYRADVAPCISFAPLLEELHGPSMSQTHLPQLNGLDDMLKSLLDDSGYPSTSSLTCPSSDPADDSTGVDRLLRSCGDAYPIQSIIAPARDTDTSSCVADQSLPAEPTLRWNLPVPCSPLGHDDRSPGVVATFSSDDPWASFSPLFDSLRSTFADSSGYSTPSPTSSPSIPHTPPPPILSSGDTVFFEDEGETSTSWDCERPALAPLGDPPCSVDHSLINYPLQFSISTCANQSCDTAWSTLFDELTTFEAESQQSSSPHFLTPPEGCSIEVPELL